MNNQTLEYYNKAARGYSADTFSVDVSGLRERFLKYLAPGARILDFGCGSGRDAKAFLEAGYRAAAADGSPELCRIASENAGIPVKCMRFRELDAAAEYDGIWACASLLHLPKGELPDVFRRMAAALKPGGCLYVSFKYGNFEGERNGRHFTDMTEEDLKELTGSGHFGEWMIEEMWITGDARPGRAAEKWLNAILKMK